MTMTVQANALPKSAATQTAEQTLRQKAVDLEASFLSEMLKHAGFGAARESFGGGIGEEQFASFLREEHANALAQKGGIGLAESIFRALQKGAEHAG